MDEEDLINSIGTLAKSGTKAYIEHLKKVKMTEFIFIGSMGFYSAFVVASRVDGSPKLGSDIAYKWSSTGDGTYTIEQVQLDSVGTEIVLHIKDDCKDYLEDWKLRQIINKYSDHLPIGFMMRKQSSEDDKVSDEFEVVNHKICFMESWIKVLSQKMSINHFISKLLMTLKTHCLGYMLKQKVI